MKDESSFIASSKRSDAPSKGRVRYRNIEDIHFKNTFDEKQVSRDLPKAEKGKRKKKKVEYERVSAPRPPAEKVEYLCNSCNEYEERYQNWALDSASANESYFCRDCMKGSGSGKAKKRKVKKD